MAVITSLDAELSRQIVRCVKTPHLLSLLGLPPITFVAPPLLLWGRGETACLATLSTPVFISGEFLGGWVGGGTGEGFLAAAAHAGS